MKKLIFTLFICLPFLLFSQSFPICGYDLMVDKYQKVNPNYKKSIDEAFEVAKNWSMKRTVHSNANSLLRLPVVVHVLYENDAENISEAIIQSQIDVLNEDFQRLNSDTVNTRDEFTALAGRGNFEFFLATTDPNGNPTDGITRTPTTKSSFMNQNFEMDLMKSPTTGGVLGWPSNKYINIWVCDISINEQVQILGFATPPNGLANWGGDSPTTPQLDGIVIYYEMFGREAVVNMPTPVAFLGRVATHEMGHYLGLRHIWGDGICGEDDGIEDTPLSSSSSQNICDHEKNSCLDAPYDYMDMVENYMDYSNPSCQNIFTKGQLGLIHVVLANQRVDLVQTTIDLKSHEVSQFRAYPNPTNDILNVDLEGINKPSKLELLDISGQVILEIELKQKDTKRMQLSTGHFSRGIYFLKLQTKSLLSRTQKVILN